MYSRKTLSLPSTHTIIYTQPNHTHAPIYSNTHTHTHTYTYYGWRSVREANIRRKKMHNAKLNSKQQYKYS